MTEKKLSRYLIGIDLGTTTCSLSYLDSLDEKREIRTLPIEQWEDKNSLIKSEVLPSFCYLASKKEIKNQIFSLPIYQEEESVLKSGSLVLGRFAQEKQVDESPKVISSAKSWLCHSGVNREDKILPWHSDMILGEDRHSPIDVLSYLLLHLRLTWNSTLGKHDDDYKLENQRVIITVPASFDETATSLTLRAAKKAGFREELTSLLEEPQAAFHSWLQEARNSDFLKAESGTQNLLVCDIGGGTSDFSLFEVNQTEGNELHCERTKVSQHILLGGDNLDLKIASLFEASYEDRFKKKLNSHQWAHVVSASRQLKEKLLKEEDASQDRILHMSVPPEKPSRNLFKSTITLSLEESVLRQNLMESFFPQCKAKTQSLDTSSPRAISELGLPYAQDPAFTHHLSEFLDGKEVHKVLFVGGTLTPRVLRKKLLESITQWQGTPCSALNKEVRTNTVSKGAALFAFSERDPKEQKIISGYPRGLYLELEDKKGHKNLLCLVPKGHQKKELLPSSGTLDLELKVNQEIHLSLYSSTERESDSLGDLIPLIGSSLFKKLPPLQTKIEVPGKKQKGSLKVKLESGLTETGLLKIFCCELSGNRKWELSFNIRDQKNRKFETLSLGEDLTNLEPNPNQLKRGKELLLHYFGKSKKGSYEIQKPKSSSIISELESILSQEKRHWSLETLRSLAWILVENRGSRGRSPAHEACWFNLCGYFLRPGYGHPLDGSSVSELEKLFDEGLRNPGTTQVNNEWWVFWRRLSGGLSKELQKKIFSKIFPKVRSGDISSEMIMTLGSLELVDPSKKALLLNKLSEDIGKIGSLYLDQKFWALTHLASRNLLYSGPENMIRPSFLEASLENLLELPNKVKEKHKEALIRHHLYSNRLVGDREFDLPEGLRMRAKSELVRLGAKQEETLPLEKVIKIKSKERRELLGDSLPSGLSLS